MSEKRSYFARRSRPPRNDSSITKLTPTTVPPSPSTRPAIASTVPPVASTSSWMTTRAPPPIASAATSREFWPYSSAYVAETVSGGSLPGRRAATNPQPASTAIAGPSQKPRASAPSTRSARRSRVQPASSLTACRRASGSSRSGEMSLKPTPGSGKSGTSRTRVVRSIPAMRARLLDEVADVAPQKQVCELLRVLRESLQVRDGGLPSLGAARAQGGCDHGFEEAALPIGRGAERPQVPGADPEARERLAGRRELRLTLGVESLPVLDPRLEQPEFLEFARTVDVDACALAELLEIELLLSLVDHAAAPTPVLAGARFELLPDDAERQELVALQAEDRLQALHVVLREEPVAALRAPRSQQALILEVADLRDRDIRELVLEPAAHRPDRQEPAARGCLGHRHQRWRKVSRYLPIWSSSPSRSSAFSTRSRLTKVPFRLPWSSSRQRSPSFVKTACLRETVTSSRKIAHSGERPIVVGLSSTGNVSPERPPPDRTIRAAPWTPRSSIGSRLSGISGTVNASVDSPSSGTTSGEPHFAQKRADSGLLYPHSGQ